MLTSHTCKSYLLSSKHDVVVISRRMPQVITDAVADIGSIRYTLRGFVHNRRQRVV